MKKRLLPWTQSHKNEKSQDLFFLRYISGEVFRVLELFFHASLNNKSDFFKVPKLLQCHSETKFNIFPLFDLLEMHLWREMAVGEFQIGLEEIKKVGKIVRCMYGI